MSLSKHLVLILAAWLLAACAGAPGMPETTYYRLPAPTGAVTPLEKPAVALPIVVEVLSADGLYSDQALIYALDAEADQLRAYHYQLWIDPPTRLLQRRLIETLRTTRVSRVVTDRLPTQMETLRVQGRIARLERVPTANGWDVVVALVLRAESSNGGRPWVIGEYQQRIGAEGTRMVDSVQAFGQALDRIGAEFLADLVEQAKTREVEPEAMRFRHRAD